MSKKIKLTEEQKLEIKARKKEEREEFKKYYDEDNARKLKDGVVMKRLIKYIKPYYKTFIFAVITVLISSFMMSYVSKIAGDIIDIITVPGTVFKDVVGVCILLISFVVIAMVITYFRGLMLNRVGQKVLFDIRNEVFEHIESLSLKEIDKTPVGTFVTRVTNDTNSLSDLFSSVLVRLMSEVTTLIYAIILMFIESWRVSLIVMAVLPLLVLSVIIFRKFSRRAFRRITYCNSRLNSFLSENLSGMKITQIFNQEETKMKEFDVLSHNKTLAGYQAIIVFGIFRPFIYMVYVFGNVLIFYFGGKMVMAGTLTLGSLYALYLFNGNMFNPIQNIAQQYNTLQSAFASAEKIFTILDTKSSIKFSSEPKIADNFMGMIEFKDVWFAYKDNDWIIKGMSFHVKPGETISFVGPTGAGKTTILSLIGRYYDPQKGEILIDGINIKDYDLASLRRNIGEMLQDVFLFSGTIKDNITLRDEEISDEEVIEASKYVNADKFIEKLPNKYDEVVRERGNNYSQGERQLLSFARVIVYKPRMIILDEATSNIDTETEVLIQDSLEKIKSIGTTIMVAHRLSTIQHSDKIFFIDDGRIIESGNHQELLKLKGRYYNLYQLQYK